MVDLWAEAFNHPMGLSAKAGKYVSGGAVIRSAAAATAAAAAAAAAASSAAAAVAVAAAAAAAAAAATAAAAAATADGRSILRGHRCARPKTCSAVAAPTTVAVASPLMLP